MLIVRIEDMNESFGEFRLVQEPFKSWAVHRDVALGAEREGVVDFCEESTLGLVQWLIIRQGLDGTDGNVLGCHGNDELVERCFWQDLFGKWGLDDELVGALS